MGYSTEPMEHLSLAVQKVRTSRVWSWDNADQDRSHSRRPTRITLTNSYLSSRTSALEIVVGNS